MGKLTYRIIDHLHGIEDLKEKLRKIFWLQLNHYEHHEGLGRIVFMTLPMNTWIADTNFELQRMVGLLIIVLRKGQRKGILNKVVRAGVLLDLMLGFVQRSFFMWIKRGQKLSLTEQANDLFEMVWQGMVNPEDESQERDTNKLVSSS